MKAFTAIDTNPTTSLERTIGKTFQSMVLGGGTKSCATRTHVEEKFNYGSCHDERKDGDDKQNTNGDKNGGFSVEQSPRNNIKRGGVS